MTKLISILLLVVSLFFASQAAGQMIEDTMRMPGAMPHDLLPGDWMCIREQGNTYSYPARDMRDTGAIIRVTYDSPNTRYIGRVLRASYYMTSWNWVVGDVRWLMEYVGEEWGLFVYNGFQVRHGLRAITPDKTAWVETHYPCQLTIEELRSPKRPYYFADPPDGYEESSSTRLDFFTRNGCAERWLEHWYKLKKVKTP